MFYPSLLESKPRDQWPSQVLFFAFGPVLLQTAGAAQEAQEAQEAEVPMATWLFMVFLWFQPKTLRVSKEISWFCKTTNNRGMI